MTSKTSLRRITALLTVLACVACVAPAQASANENTISERIMGLYANRHVIESLREGIIPPGLEDVIEPIDNPEGHMRYRNKEDGLEWLVLYQDHESIPPTPQDRNWLELYAPLGEPAVLCLKFPMYTRALFYYSGDGLFWQGSIPDEDFVEALTEFIELAAMCVQPADELTGDELAERRGEVEAFLSRRKTRSEIWFEGLRYENNHKTCMMMEHNREMYRAERHGNNAWFWYKLTRAEYEALYDICAPLAPEERDAHVADYVASTGLLPYDSIIRVQIMDERGREKSGYLKVRGTPKEPFWLLRWDEEEEDMSIQLALGLEAVNALANELLPLSPAERGVFLGETGEIDFD
ncbi:MAG: hypothetical protein FWD25_01550 [Clostridia bacterium]|nr:hypothetical protein [Clostridia bacterium]